MDDRFNAEEWAKMPVRDRARSCIVMASAARKLAERDPALKDEYLVIAKHWDELAAEIEKASLEV